MIRGTSFAKSLCTAFLRCCVLGVCAIPVIALTPTTALSQAAFDHTARIEAALRQIGSESDFSRATDEQLGQLWVHLTSRGQFLLDLYALDREMLAEFAAQRDSAAKAGGSGGPGSTFFLARALHELGRSRDAATAYARIGAKSPALIRNDAAAWSGSLGGRGGDSWQQALTDWRQGKAVVPRTCPAEMNVACPLFMAIVSGDVPLMLRLQREALRRTEPEYADTLIGKAGRFSVEYHDPANLYVMGIADFYVAARILQGRRTLEFYRGVALLRAGRPKDALQALTSAGAAAAPLVAVFLGEAQYATGDPGGAEQTWRRVSPGAAMNLLADSRSAVSADAGTSARQFAEENKRDLSNLRTPSAAGANLARALLRVSRTDEAFSVLRVMRPLSVTPSLDRVPPLVQVLTAHALYKTGFARREQSRYLDALTELLPVARLGGAAGTFRLLQAVSVPKSGNGDVR